MTALAAALCTTLQLSTDFDRAAQDLARHMRELQKPAIAALPRFSESHWRERPRATERTNCYHFAVGGRFKTLELLGEGPIEKLAPGEMRFRFENRDAPDAYARKNAFVHHICDGSEGDFMEFASETVNGAVHDGMVPVGRDFQLVTGATPMILFLSERLKGNERLYNDYHWYGLRRLNGKPVWCSKLPERMPVIHATPQAVFDYAREDGYTHFAGYVQRPHDLEARYA